MGLAFDHDDSRGEVIERVSRERYAKSEPPSTLMLAPVI